MVFLDASALVKRYVTETGSAFVRQLIANSPIAISRLSEVEVGSALARRAREGSFSPKQRDRALAALGNDLSALHVVELVPEVTAEALSLVRRQELRAADAIQFASCLILSRELGEAVPLVVFDDRLRRVARREQHPTLP